MGEGQVKDESRVEGLGLGGGGLGTPLDDNFIHLWPFGSRANENEQHGCAEMVQISSSESGLQDI